MFEAFATGVFEGGEALIKVCPGIMMFCICINMLKASGFFNYVALILEPILEPFGISKDIIPLALIRPVSGSGAIAVLTDILKNNTPTSRNFICASLMMGCTETTFYTISVYFSCAKATKLRHTLRCALMADFTGIICAILFSQLL